MIFLKGVFQSLGVVGIGAGGAVSNLSHSGEHQDSEIMVNVLFRTALSGNVDTCHLFFFFNHCCTFYSCLQFLNKSLSLYHREDKTNTDFSDIFF